MMNARKPKKKTFFRKPSTCKFERQDMPLKLFEFHGQFMIDHYVIKLTQFEKTGSIDKFLLQLGNLIIKFHCRNKKLITFLVAFKFQLFDSGVCLPFSKENKVHLKNQKSNCKKSNLSVNTLRGQTMYFVNCTRIPQQRRSFCSFVFFDRS